MARRKGVKECACCDNILSYKQHRYCSKKCAKMYKSGKIMYGVGKIGFSFKNWSYLLNLNLMEAKNQGHEYVTVRFN